MSMKDYLHLSGALSWAAFLLYFSSISLMFSRSSDMNSSYSLSALAFSSSRCFSKDPTCVATISKRRCKLFPTFLLSSVVVCTVNWLSSLFVGKGHPAFESLPSASSQYSCFPFSWCSAWIKLVLKYPPEPSFYSELC